MDRCWWAAAFLSHALTITLGEIGDKRNNSSPLINAEVTLIIAFVIVNSCKAMASDHDTHTHHRISNSRCDFCHLVFQSRHTRSGANLVQRNRGSEVFSSVVQTATTAVPSLRSGDDNLREHPAPSA